MQIIKADASLGPAAIPFKNKTTRAKVWAVLPWVVFGGACILFVVGLIINYPSRVDSDMSSELVLAKMLSDGKGFIITNQWYYSTELRFLNTQLIFTPLFWLFNSWAVVRIVGTIILNGIMLAAFYFLLASLQRKNLFPWLATFLLLPTSSNWMHFFNTGAFYLPHIAISFTTLGLIFSALRAEKTKKRNWLIAGSVILSCLAGVGGFRQLVVTNIPLFVSAVLYWWLNLRTGQTGVGVKFIAASGLALAGALGGLLLNFFLGSMISFYDFLDITWQVPTWDNLLVILTSLFTALGWRTGKIGGGGNFW